MLTIRVIPCLLKHNRSLVKTINFKKFNYIGDPLNTVKIFNNLEVDELMLLDITATKEKKSPDFDLIQQIATECFMPLTYGGGVCSIYDMKKIFSLGVEKIVICSYAFENPNFITQATNIFGSQSVVVSIDIKKNILGKYEVYTHSGTKNTKLDPILYAKIIEKAGAGEILLNSIDNDGKMEGYNLEIIKSLSKSIKIPLVVCGGAGNYKDLSKAVKWGASAVAAGSLFVYQNKNKAVLVNYPTENDMKKIFKKKRN